MTRRRLTSVSAERCRARTTPTRPASRSRAASPSASPRDRIRRTALNHEDHEEHEATGFWPCVLLELRVLRDLRGSRAVYGSGLSRRNCLHPATRSDQFLPPTTLTR